MINNTEFENKIELINLIKIMYLDFQNIYIKKRKIERNIYKEENIEKYNMLKEKIQFIYDQGYGLKIIARNLNISYTVCRQIFGYLDISINKGYNVVTDKLREFRKNKALYENKANIGFNNSSIIRKHKKDNRGMQGYIWNSTLSKFIWIRSSYEYIFAKWLNKNNIKWEYDLISYNLSDGTKYRPDFFLLDDFNEIKTIIEIKGYWDNRLYKVYLLKEMFPNIKISIIGSSDINSYIDINSNMSIEKEKWNLERKLNKITKEQNGI